MVWAAINTTISTPMALSLPAHDKFQHLVRVDPPQANYDSISLWFSLARHEPFALAHSLMTWAVPHDPPTAAPRWSRSALGATLTARLLYH